MWNLSGFGEEAWDLKELPGEHSSELVRGGSGLALVDGGGDGVITTEVYMEVKSQETFSKSGL